MAKTLTIFDLDNTLIKGDSSTVWSRFMVREGWVNDPGYLAQWRRAHPEYSGEVTFYTDSINDLPLCLPADNVRLVNPCPQLTAANVEHQWPVLEWRL